MSKLSHLFVAAAVVLMAVGCAEKEAAPVPIAPILKDIVMPAESSSIPGTTIKIMGKGFDVSDKITCKSMS